MYHPYHAQAPFKGPKNDKPMKAKEVGHMKGFFMRPLHAQLFQERPKKKLSKEADKAARMAIGSGDLAKVLKK